MFPHSTPRAAFNFYVAAVDHRKSPRPEGALQTSQPRLGHPARKEGRDRPKPPCWSPTSSRPSSLASFSLPSSPLVCCAHSIRPAVLPATGWPLSNLTLEDSVASERREGVRHEGARAPQAQPGLEPDGFSDLPRTGHASAGRSEVNSAQTSTDGARLSGQE